MAVMGFRLSQRANGVSLLHGEVSRHMFNGLWPAFDESEVPITSITNGVHAPTWVGREVFELAAKAGADIDSDDPDVWSVVDKIPAQGRCGRPSARCARCSSRTPVRRLRKSWLQRGAAPAELGWIDKALDPDVLTIGFARRVPSYKRLTLMLRDPERLKRLLLDPERPVQLVIAGKSHPADEGGKKLIQEIVRFADDPEVRHRIVFLPNYDIAMAQPLYPGCDVWLNNPLRPYEACGTSGMKAALNGGLNLSILDGWWDEWYDGDNGWAIPSADGVEDVDARDDIEATALYDLIEKEVAARFYDLDGQGLPVRWIEMVRHTLKSLGPKVLSTRMVREYVERLYTPSAVSSRAMNDSFEGATVARPLEVARRGRVVRRTRRPRRDRGPPRRPRDRRRHGPARVRLPRRPDARRRVGRGRARPRQGRGPARRHDRRPRWRWPRPTRAAGTASTATSSSPAPAPSATPSGSCRTPRPRLARRAGPGGPGLSGRLRCNAVFGAECYAAAHSATEHRVTAASAVS